MNSGKIIVQIGNRQESFKDGGYYSSESCDLIESMISCNKTKLSSHGGSGRIRFVKDDGNLVVQLSVLRGNSFMTDEGKAIVVIRCSEGSIRSNAYYGVESEMSFSSDSEVYSMSSVSDCIDSLKSFYRSWKVKKGEISAIVVILDKIDIFKEVVKDSFFDNCYVLLAE